MTRRAEGRFGWLINRRVGMSLAWGGLIVTAALAANIAGLRLVGDINGWDHWLHAHAALFLAWRLCLYAATARGWWWMRQRVLAREPSPDTRQRFLRIEIAAVMAIVLLEGSDWMQYEQGIRQP